MQCVYVLYIYITLILKVSHFCRLLFQPISCVLFSLFLLPHVPVCPLHYPTQ